MTQMRGTSGAPGGADGHALRLIWPALSVTIRSSIALRRHVLPEEGEQVHEQDG